MMRRLLVALLLATPALAVQPGASGTVGLKDGVVDVVKVDGGDSAAGTTLAANRQHVAVRRADDCTAQTDGAAGDICVDDFVGVVICVPTAGACDTAAEWKRLIAGIRTGTTVPATCAVGDPLFFDTDAAAGARVQLCVATNTWLALDNPFGSQINASELENTMSLSAAQVFDLTTNDADLRVAITATNGTNEGSLYIDSTSNEPEWYAGGALRKLEDYARLAGRSAGQSLFGGNTADASDNQVLTLGSGGAAADTRGAYMQLYGNENGGNGDLLAFMGDDSSGGAFAVYTNNANAGAFGAADFAVEYDGNVCIQEPAISVSGCTRDLGIGGLTARTIGMERHTTANTAGNNLTVNSGGATSGATDKNGGSLILAPGVATGQGKAYAILQSPTRATATGTADQTMIDRIVVGGKRTLTDASATAVVSATIASGSMAAGIIHYSIEATNGTDYQVETGEAHYAAVNKAGTVTANVTETAATTQAVSSGTRTSAWTISAASPTVISVSADTSLTPSTGYPRITFWIENLTDQAVAPQ